jgi:hypothetical protein
MYQKQMMIILFAMLLVACGAGEAITERAAEGLLDEALGEGSMATIEAAGTAIMQTAEPILTEESTPEPIVDEESAIVATEVAAETAQNDANTGGDAGNFNDPAQVNAGTGYTALLTGFQAGGDLQDVYQVQAEPHTVTRITVHNVGENVDPITLQARSAQGETVNPIEILPGSSETLVFAFADSMMYEFAVMFLGNDTADYTFDVVFEPENDAGLGTDAPATVAEAAPIALDTVYTGVSVGWDVGGHDPDCYRVTMPTMGILTVNLTSPVNQAHEAFASAEIYDNAGNFLTSDTAQYGTTLAISHGSPGYEVEAGDYTICFETYEYYSYGEYEFMVTVN